MAQFDVYENQNQETNTAIPYLLNVQGELLENLATRVVVPLITASAMGKAVKHLDPQFEIRRATIVMSTAELAGIPVRILGEKFGSLKERRNEIIAALDFLFTDFSNHPVRAAQPVDFPSLQLLTLAISYSPRMAALVGRSDGVDHA